jgi:hypothetical protein
MDWKGIGGTLSNYFSPTDGTASMAPIQLGNLASALMGSQQDSWQANVGRLASGLQQQKIGAEEMRRQQTEQQQFRNALMSWLTGTPGTGFGMTPKGTPGDTEVLTKKNADGTYERVVKGESGPPPAGVPQPGVQPPAQTQTRPVPQTGFQSNIAGQRIPIQALPFF